MGGLRDKKRLRLGRNVDKCKLLNGGVNTFLEVTLVIWVVSMTKTVEVELKSGQAESPAGVAAVVSVVTTVQGLGLHSSTFSAYRDVFCAQTLGGFSDKNGSGGAEKWTSVTLVHFSAQRKHI